MLPVLGSTEDFPPGSNPSTSRWPRGTRSAAPLAGSCGPRAPPSHGHLEGLPVEAKSAACLSSRVCMCRGASSVVPGSCHALTRVCVYVCVCRCVLPCLSFWCMCRSGVWLSCRLHVLVPLFSSEQCLASWCPSRRSPFLPPLPGTLSHGRPPFPAGCSAHLMSAPLSLSISDRNQSWPSCPWQARLLGPSVKEG